MITLNGSNFQKEVLDCEKPVVVLFTAQWDIVGAKTLLFLNKVITHKVGFVDFDVERDLVHKYSVTNLPRIFLFHQGHIVSALNSTANQSEFMELLKGVQ